MHSKTTASHISRPALLLYLLIIFIQYYHNFLKAYSLFKYLVPGSSSAYPNIHMTFQIKLSYGISVVTSAKQIQSLRDLKGSAVFLPAYLSDCKSVWLLQHWHLCHFLTMQERPHLKIFELTVFSGLRILFQDIHIYYPCNSRVCFNLYRRHFFHHPFWLMM